MSSSAMLKDITNAQLPETVKTVSVLGSTGSIGRSTLALIKNNPALYRINVLTANNKVEELIQQAIAIRPDWVVIGNEDKLPQLKTALDGTGIAVAGGHNAIVEAAAYPSDIVLGGIVGIASLEPILVAIRRGATIALANKESLVCAGDLIRYEVEKYNATLLPVDSEHNAIFQVFDFNRPELVEKIILTASGGPFRNLSLADMRNVTVSQAVAHPNWSMGAKISVDSATMVNKALEMIEAYQLFPVKAKQIEAIIHPESIIHSMVEYKDGSVLSQMSSPDMTLPIAYALAWPERIKTPSKKLDLVAQKSLTFEAPDETLFPALRIAREVLEARGIMPIVFNAANEVAVENFLKGHIGYLDIMRVIEESLHKITGEYFTNNTLEDILAVDAWSRRQALDIIQNLKG